MPWKFRDDAPIYTQVVDKLKTKIFIGEYLPGEKLPSVREFASEIGINPNTVQRALGDMEACGLVLSNRTSGKYITENKELIDELKSGVAMALVNEFYKKMLDLGYSNSEIINMISSKKEEDVVNG